MASNEGTSPNREFLIGLYRNMVTVRRCEEQLVKLYAAGEIYGGLHTYIGEEAVATGVCAHLRQEDMVFSTHRGHGHALSKGVTPRELIAELLGRVDGCSGGRGGSMHLFKPESGFMGSSGIVGPSILLAAGTAYSAKLLKLDRVGVAFFGDGASINGAFHEGLNLATIWGLPIVFVCENNLYATEVPLSKVTKNQSVASRSQAYGLPSEEVDGNDVLAVYQAAADAVRRARAGEGPTLLECKTYRTRPHSEGMRDAGYRTQGELTEWKTKDPIAVFKERCISQDWLKQTDLNRVDEEVKEIVEDARRFALASPMPNSSTVTNHLFSEGREGSHA